MNKTTIVAFLVILSNPLFAQPLTPAINAIESQWAQLYYAQNHTGQKAGYPLLLNKTGKLLEKHPQSAELMIWHAIITSTNAAFEGPFSALSSIDRAKSQLEQAIQINPHAMDGAAFVALGTLYYMTPGWPISFGDHHKAEHLLKKALTINPQSIDANYFYADYLLTHEQPTEASKYLKRALAATSRPEQAFADEQLKLEARSALNTTEQTVMESSQYTFFSLFFSAKNSN
jgi:tetratricopeptide (TPR) repeat protein